MKLVLDTNIVLSGFFWNGSPKQLMDRRLTDDIRFVTSPDLLAELTDVLSRRKFKSLLAQSNLSIKELVARYVASALIVSAVPIPRTAPDPKDDMVIGTALAANADFIVTGDAGLLSVVEYSGVRIAGVSEILTLLSGAPQST